MIQFQGRELIGSSTYPMPNDAVNYQVHLTTLDALSEPDNKIATLYIHTPFCDQICSFCGFNKFVSTEDKEDATADKIISPATQKKTLNRVKFMRTYQLQTSQSPFFSQPKQVGVLLGDIIDSTLTES